MSAYQWVTESLLIRNGGIKTVCWHKQTPVISDIDELSDTVMNDLQSWYGRTSATAISSAIAIAGKILTDGLLHHALSEAYIQVRPRHFGNAITVE